MDNEADDSESDVVNHLLRDYEKTLDDLKRENRLEKDARFAFAELAAKVKAEVDRRTGADRRATPRAVPDRRVNNQNEPSDSDTVESA
jgi:hypothetical protein